MQRTTVGREVWQAARKAQELSGVGARDSVLGKTL